MKDTDTLSKFRITQMLTALRIHYYDKECCLSLIGKIQEKIYSGQFDSTLPDNKLSDEEIKAIRIMLEMHSML